MLSKKDLAKEFSQVVQQEIKNHNDQILSSNMAIDGFRRTILEIRERSEKNLSEISSKLGNYISQHNDCYKEAKENLDRAFREIQEQDIKNREQLFSMKKSMDDRESYFLTLEGFQHFQQKVDQWIANIQMMFSSQKDSVRQSLEKIQKLISEQIELSKLEVRKETLDCVEKINQVNKFIDRLAIDRLGILKEIEVLKKRCFVTEKNIENIYTQIELLKGTQ